MDTVSLINSDDTSCIGVGTVSLTNFNETSCIAVGTNPEQPYNNSLIHKHIFDACCSDYQIINGFGNFCFVQKNGMTYVADIEIIRRVQTTPPFKLSNYNYEDVIIHIKEAFPVASLFDMLRKQEKAQ